MTIRTTFDNGATFANYNAIGERLPSLDGLDTQRLDIGKLVGEDVDTDFEGIGYRLVRWSFTRLEAL
jgi:hypothetical protein